jgi:uncharacterized phage infection (PIP) family protein YhgE
MDIRDAVNAIADLANAIEEAINEAEGKEGEIADQLETLERVKDELEAGRSDMDDLLNVLTSFDGTRLADALDEAADLNI